MITLHFSQLYRLTEIEDLNSNQKQKDGIYIWGFKHKKCKDGSIGEPKIDKKSAEKEELVFVPYYVGKAANIVARLKQHRNIQKGDRRKYTRLHLRYMKDFSTEKHLINYCQKERDAWIRENGLDKVQYINNKHIIESLYPNAQEVLVNGEPISPDPFSKCDCPIDSVTIDGRSLCESDTLKELIAAENWWFCYTKDIKFDSKEKVNLVQCESRVFWFLKGVTLSRVTHSLEKAESFNHIEIDDGELFNRGVKIFRNNASKKTDTSKIFPGYC